MSKAEAVKNLRLMHLGEWAERHFTRDKWPTTDFTDALKEYCLMKWGISEGAAKNMAKIVQLRLTRTVPQELPVPEGRHEVPVGQASEMSLNEILMADRVVNASDYAVPKTDFKIVEES